MTDILVIEDNKELGTLICDFLKKDGFSVEWKENSVKDIVRVQGIKFLHLQILLPDVENVNGGFLYESNRYCKED